MKFRKKQVVIEAVQWKGYNQEEIQKFMKDSDRDIGYVEEYDILIIYTLEGQMEARKNDWIIKGIKGEFYPCKPDIFKETYEEVTQ